HPEDRIPRIQNLGLGHFGHADILFSVPANGFHPGTSFSGKNRSVSSVHSGIRLYRIGMRIEDGGSTIGAEMVRSSICHPLSSTFIPVFLTVRLPIGGGGFAGFHHAFEFMEIVI